MMRIRYKRHFRALFFAAMIIWSVLAFDAFPPAVDRLVFYFGLMGALHATALVISLRDRKGVAAILGFIALATVLSVVTPLSIFVPGWLTSHLMMLDQDARILLSFGLASGVWRFCILARDPLLLVEFTHVGGLADDSSDVRRGDSAILALRGNAHASVGALGCARRDTDSSLVGGVLAFTSF
jgi:hypothetical protein